MKNATHAARSPAVPVRRGRSRIAGVVARGLETAEPLRWAPLETRLFRGIGVSSGRGLCRLRLVAQLSPRTELEVHEWARERAPGARLVRDERAFRGLAAALRDYVAGKLRSFDEPLDLSGTPFQLSVWRALLDIGYGELESYGELALRIGHRGASRAVGSANGANPVPILVPCHRVVAASTIGGYGLGLDLKRALLELEGARDYERGTQRAS